MAIADVIDQKPDNDNLSKKLAVLINQEPRLGAALTDVLIEVE